MLLQTKFYCFLLHRHHQKKYVSFHNVIKFLSIQVWNIFGAKTLWVFTRFLLFLQQDENWRNTYDFRKKARSYHRNNECSFKKYFTAFFYVCYHQTNVHNGFKSILAPKLHAFSRDFYEIFFLHKDENWRNVSWKHNGIEIRNAPSNKVLLLSSTPYHQTKYLRKQRFHNGIVWIFN